MNLKSPLSSLHDSESFIARHIGPDENDIQAMLAELDYPSLDALISATLPAAIALGRPLALDAPSSEQQALQRLRQLAQQNQLCRSYIGL